jgi:hypothetical protein
MPTFNSVTGKRKLKITDAINYQIAITLNKNFHKKPPNSKVKRLNVGLSYWTRFSILQKKRHTFKFNKMYNNVNTGMMTDFTKESVDRSTKRPFSIRKTTFEFT